MDVPKVSAVIVSWNDWPKLSLCLQSLRGNAIADLEIIVLDNASQDGTPERVAKSFPDVRLIKNAANVGHTLAVNQGFGLAQGDYILVLDSDTELKPGCLGTLLTFMNTHPDVAMAAPRTFNTDGTVQESARNFPGVMSGILGRQTLLTRLFPDNPFSKRYLARDFLDATQPFSVEQIGGACMFFRRSLLDVVGPWDDRYFGYFVDTDWCRAIHSKGLRIFCVPGAQLVHHEGNSRLKKRTPRRIWIFNFGAYQYYTKWHALGVWDPRSILAGTALLLRTGLQILLNSLPAQPGGGASAASYKGADL